MFSENKKGRRGRKPRFTAKDYKPLRKYRPKTVRGRQNLIYTQRAFDILLNYNWPESVKSAALTVIAYFASKTTILAGLGRIENETDLVKLAVKISVHQLRGAAALAEIRKFRFGAREPRREILLDKIFKAVMQYRNLYPHMKGNEVKADFESVAAEFSDSPLWK